MQLFLLSRAFNYLNVTSVFSLNPPTIPVFIVKIHASFLMDTSRVDTNIAYKSEKLNTGIE